MSLAAPPGSGNLPANVHQAVQAAERAGLPRLEARMLALHALGQSPNDLAWLLLHGYDPIPADAAQRLQHATARRAAGEPVAYITGQKEFYGLTLRVDARTLDPRDDTETLVDWTLEVLPQAPPQRVADLGTGSGAIALALQQSRRHWQVLGVDRSSAALEVARHNAEILELPLQLQTGNWLDQVQGRFHAIVSNPPYIAAGDPHLAALTHEPLSALVSGSDGLDDIRRIVAQAPAHLEPGGWLLLEHGFDQADAVRALLQQAGFSSVQSRRDLAGIERCSGGRYP